MTPALSRLNKRLVLLGVWITVLGVTFWAGSRYPSLNAKAFMGGETMLEDPLSFEALVELQEGDSAGRLILLTTINWIHTNLRGMAFGLLLGASLLSAIQLIHRRSVQSGVGNTLLGMAIGAPLGVCVNCAAPVAKGIHDGGARLETTLAAMVSSPTLNVVVLTMSFSILPTYLAATKLAYSLLFILLVIPLLSRTVFESERAQTIENATCDLSTSLPGDAAESWRDALIATLRGFLASLWFIVRKTLPLMLLAGLLGATMATLVPLTSLASVESSALAAVLLAVVGLLLPVPMAFDVVLAAVLLGAGMPIPYVMILLFVLGIFSCYSAFIVATTISPRVAFVMSALLIGLGLLAGLTADGIHESELRGMIAGASATRSNTEQTLLDGPRGILPRLPDTTKRSRDDTPPPRAHVVIESVAHRPRRSEGPTPFTRRDGDSLGLIAPMDFSVEDFWPPFYNARGIASADFDNDGWQDLVVATENGPRLYRNEEGLRFERRPFDSPDVEQLDAFVVAPADLDDDGWLDLLVTTYRSGSYVLLNERGRIEASPLYRMPARDEIISHAVSFGDVDRDGDLDAAVGNWFFGGMRGSTALPANAENFLYRNVAGSFEREILAGIAGETLALLLSDWTGDGVLDLIMGNDFDPPDVYSIGLGDGRFRQVSSEDRLIPISTAATMSVDTADIDNDLVPEIYLTNIAMRPSDVGSAGVGPRLPGYCRDIENEQVRAACRANLPIRRRFAYGGAHQPSHLRECGRIEDETERVHCQGMMLMKTALRERDASLCEHIPLAHERGRFLCDIFFWPGVDVPERLSRTAIPQTRGRNVLLARRGPSWQNRARELGVENTGWSWAGKFADLDDDEWKDLYVVNGTWLKPTRVPSNVYFHNLAGERFRNETRDSGLEDHLIVSAYTYSDLDNDGDLDIVTNSVNGPFRFYRNNDSTHHAITIELRDRLGNRFGLGCKITIFYGAEAERRQIVEIKSGAGFLSHDPPIAHFGLGRFESVGRIEVDWSTGERTIHAGPFRANRHYRLERRADRSSRSASRSSASRGAASPPRSTARSNARSASSSSPRAKCATEIAPSSACVGRR